MGPDSKLVYCKLCQDRTKRQKVSYCGGTTNLTSHLRLWHQVEFKKLSEEEEKTPKSGILNFFSLKGKKVHKWPKTSAKWKDATMALAKWLCKDSRASNMVEDVGFAFFLSHICPEYDPPRAKTMAKYITELYEKETVRIKKNLENVEYCALTTDGGTSSNATSFQDTNVHYIDNDLFLQSHCLAVEENKEAHTAENYRENTDDVVKQFGIEEKIVKTVTDNENKMKAAFSKKERTGCMSHILHSSVIEGFKGSPEVEKVIGKNRKIASKFN